MAQIYIEFMETTVDVIAMLYQLSICLNGHVSKTCVKEKKASIFVIGFPLLWQPYKMRLAE